MVQLIQERNTLKQMEEETKKKSSGLHNEVQEMAKENFYRTSDVRRSTGRKGEVLGR